MGLRRPKRTPQDQPARRAVTAATAIVDLAENSSWKSWKFGNRDWQTEAWRLYDIVPEHHFLAGRIGDAISQARLYVTEVGETGEETGEVTEERIARLAAVPLGKGAQRDDNLRLGGIDLAVGGEFYAIGEGAAVSPETAEGNWFVVTGAAVKNEGGLVKVKRPRSRDGGWLTLTDGVDIMARCWRSHPNDTDQADSFTRSAIPALREIELLTKREFAELDSRLTGAGIMFVPEGIDFPRDEQDPAGLAGFMAYIQRAAAASMRDQGTANSMVPILATIPDQLLEHLDKIRPLNFWSELSGEIGQMKKDAIERLANSAEIPRETLTGMSDANHWSAWLISDEGIRWIKGYLSLIADTLTRAFLRLALTSMGVADPERYAFAFDTSALAAKPNRLDEALQLHDRFMLKDEEVVKAGAFDPEQMPSTTERAAQILLKLIQAQPDLILDPKIQTALGLPQIESTAPAQQPAISAPGDDQEPVDGPPNNGAAPEQPDENDLSARLGERVRLALSSSPEPHVPSPEAVLNASARLMVYRALELAGGRLVTPGERRGRWRDVPRHELHARVGPITPEKAERVLLGAWNHIDMVALDLGVDSDDLHRLLNGYVTELLTRGMAHHDDLLFAALNIAHRGRGLVAA